jgi:hypothetical protein
VGGFAVQFAPGRCPCQRHRPGQSRGLCARSGGRPRHGLPDLAVREPGQECRSGTGLRRWRYPGASWSVLAEDGVIVSTASPAILATPGGPSRPVVHESARRCPPGRYRPTGGGGSPAVPGRSGGPFEDLPAAIERSRTLPQMGKTVVDFLR